MGIFLLMMPLFIVLIQKEKWHFLALKLNKLWAKAFFASIFIPYEIELRGELREDQRYIICANHFSYLDIPTLGLSPINFKFMGKDSLSNVPLFGYMFKKLHITVNRSDFRHRYKAYEKAKEALDKGFNLAIYPEGGMRTKNPPTMAAFREGPFRIAIERQIPIVPVTIPYNWIILPDDDKFLLRWHKAKMIFHEPVETKGLNKEDVDKLKERVYTIIDTELKSHFVGEMNKPEPVYSLGKRE